MSGRLESRNITSFLFLEKWYLCFESKTAQQLAALVFFAAELPSKVGIFGRNGSGKSTIMKILGGEKPSWWIRYFDYL